jgi:DNA polymerase-4
MPRSIHAAGALNCILPRVPAYTPSDLSVALTHLDLAPSPDLFGIDPFNEPNAKQRVVTALDTINARYGLNTVYLGSIHQPQGSADPDSLRPSATA